MNKEQIVMQLAVFPWPKSQWWLTAGGAMVLYGLREQTQDIDLGCSTELADKLQEKGYKTETSSDGRRRIRYSDLLELSEKYQFGELTQIDGIPILTLEGLLEQKRHLNRDKDQMDILALERALKIQEEIK